MDYNFTGSSRPVRQINLGGQSQSGTGQSPSQLAANARAQRAQRELVRRKNAAATLIQSTFRGTQAAHHVRHQWLAQFDQLAAQLELQAAMPTDTDTHTDHTPTLINATRLLVFGLQHSLAKQHRPEHLQLLARWSRLVASSTPTAPLPLPLVLQPFSKNSPEHAARWLTLLVGACRLLLVCLANYGSAIPPDAAMSYFHLLRLVTNTDPSSHAASTRINHQSLPELLLDTLMSHNLHYSLQRFIITFPVNRSASSSLAPAISLSLAPLRAFKSSSLDGSTPTAAIILDVDGGHSDSSSSSQSPAATLHARAIRAFCTCILTIPQLPHRIPLSSVTELASAFPFLDIVHHIQALGAYVSVSSGDSVLPDNPLHSPYFLANFLTFGGPKRLSLLKHAASVKSYLDALSLCQNALPAHVFLSPTEWSAHMTQDKPKNLAEYNDDDDEDDESGHDDHHHSQGAPTPASSRHAHSNGAASLHATAKHLASQQPHSRLIPAYTLPIDVQTHKRLAQLVSEEHISGLFAASGRFPTSTRGALCSFLTATLSVWPSAARERVLNTIMYGYGRGTTGSATTTTTTNNTTNARAAAGFTVGGLVFEIWRGYIRGGKLARRLASAQPGSGAKETLSTLSDAQYAEEWPAMILLCELYSRCLLTIGDDEFYPSNTGPLATEASRAAPSRNPLTLDEVVSLSGLLRNVAFAMYWHEGTGLLAHLDSDEARVPGVRTSLLSLRRLLTKLLRQLHARDSRRQFTPDKHWLMVSQLDLQTFIQTVILEEKELASRGGQPLIGADDAAPGAVAAAAAAQAGVFSSDLRQSALAAGAMDVDLDSDQEEEQEESGIASELDQDGLPRLRTQRRQQQQSLPVSERILANNNRMSKLSARNLAFLSPRLGVLNNIPFVIPFEVRVEIFRQFVRIDAHRNGVMQNVYRRGHPIKIRRGHIAEDGFAQLNQLGPRLKDRIEITFFDQWGMPEAGIDGGGVYKEFLTSLVREAFDTDRGLWKATDTQEIYPNPHSYAKRADQLEWYTFLGRVLGKAVYEDILVDVKFASFFLSKWLGKQTYLDDLASLDSLDKELYRGLIYLKNYPGDVEADLALNFTVTDNEFGVSKTTELVPGGADVPVTRENRLEYMYRVSHYRLSAQIAPQCTAFFRGLSEMIDPRWLRMFNREELRMLVCGTEEPIDVADLRANTVYGGFHPKDMAVEYFWKALESFDQPMRKAFLKFVTSSPNPPLLGFGELNPKFSIRNAGTDASRLPTASTCVNLLKLPEYNDEQTCRDKLVYAIQSGAGFDLS